MAHQHLQLGPEGGTGSQQPACHHMQPCVLRSCAAAEPFGEGKALSAVTIVTAGLRVTVRDFKKLIVLATAHPCLATSST